MNWERRKEAHEDNADAGAAGIREEKSRWSLRKVAAKQLRSVGRQMSRGEQEV